MASPTRIAEPPAAMRLAVGRLAGRTDLVVGAGVALFVVALASSQGGYFPTAWGWGALLLLAPVLVAWAAGRAEPLDAWRGTFLALVLALAGWTALSISWSAVPDQSVLETERMILCVGAALAAVTFVRRHATLSVPSAILAAIGGVCTYSLATRLFPERLGVYDPLGIYRLADPLGYWNALAVFAGIGLLLAVIHVARSRRMWTHCVSAALVPILVATLYFTFGRAAWIALGIGLLVALAFDPHRIQLAAVVLTLVPTGALAVLVCAHERALTHRGMPIAAVSAAGHAAAWRIGVLVLAAAAIEAVRLALARRIRIPTAVRIAFGLVCLLVVLGGAIGAVARAGGPTELAHRAKATFSSSPVPQGSNLNSRLFSFSGNGRRDLWHAAWHMARAHPWLGEGAGTFERYWLRNRPNAAKVRDAHSLYLETLAELGPVGLALVASILVFSLAACWRRRHHRYTAGIAGAVALYAAHAAVDWDWEVSVLAVIVILLTGAAIGVADDPRPATRTVSAPWRSATSVAVAALAVLALGGLAGNRALAQSDTAAANGDWPASAHDALHAQRWLPWSPAPWLDLGTAQLAVGQDVAARVSFRRALRRDRGNWLAWLDLAQAERGRARAAALREGTRLNPHSPEIAAYKASLAGGGS